MMVWQCEFGEVESHILPLSLHQKRVCAQRSVSNRLTTNTASHTHYWILLQVHRALLCLIPFRMYQRLVLTWNDTSNCKIHVLKQPCHSLTMTRSSWENSPTAPTYWTRRPVTKRGSASWISCWLIPMKCALRRESTMWVSMCMCDEATPPEQHLALDDKALYPQIL